MKQWRGILNTLLAIGLGYGAHALVHSFWLEAGRGNSPIERCELALHRAMVAEAAQTDLYYQAAAERDACSAAFVRSGR